MAVFKCKMCGGTLEISENQTIATCEYCGTEQTLPRLDDDKKANLYDRANHFRRNNEFDKAMSIYETILNEDNTDAEAYWSIVLCRYGVEYVEDPTSHKRIPTVNRTQFTSIFDDDNYKMALQYADSNQISIYKEEATAINEIQKGILEISQNEKPFDVFICYKETDNNGKRTSDSVLANDLYHQLTQEGFRVFYSAITLENKLGQAYEPYIFAALNSAKVMVVIGTKVEYFNAIWVKNEWSRYLSLVKSSKGKKVLIPAYKNMDPYDLPDEFSHLQAQDMSKLGFMQDLIRGIKKLTTDQTPTVVQPIIHNNVANSTDPLLERAFMFLQDGDFAKAEGALEQVLNINPHIAQAYVGKLMVLRRVLRVEDLANQKWPLSLDVNYKYIMQYGDDELTSKIKQYDSAIISENKKTVENVIATTKKNIQKDIDERKQSLGPLETELIQEKQKKEYMLSIYNILHEKENINKKKRVPGGCMVSIIFIVLLTISGIIISQNETAGVAISLISCALLIIYIVIRLVAFIKRLLKIASIKKSDRQECESYHYFGGKCNEIEKIVTSRSKEICRMQSILGNIYKTEEELLEKLYITDRTTVTEDTIISLCMPQQDTQQENANQDYADEYYTGEEYTEEEYNEDY